MPTGRYRFRVSTPGRVRVRHLTGQTMKETTKGMSQVDQRFATFYSHICAAKVLLMQEDPSRLLIPISKILAGVRQSLGVRATNRVSIESTEVRMPQISMSDYTCYPIARRPVMQEVHSRRRLGTQS